ncbi:unnamed protein product, partial [Mesorhabditis belari]|uniref:Uncharacterized protein n=1 Tax=Mesorhabditis belari TaxID=2138241 RepID=A0AAF3FJW2_9BILA
MQWKTISLLVCLYGVIKEFRPATPFLTPFLVSDAKNLSIETVYSDIYPFWTYSYLICLIPILALTDLLRYKPLVIVEAIGLCLTWALLVWAQGVQLMQLMQIVFGLASAAEIAFSSYLFAVVDVKQYRRVTSWTKTSVLIGKLFAFALAQFLVSWLDAPYLLLNQITFIATIIALFVALTLPTVPKSRPDVVQNVEEAQPKTTYDRKKRKSASSTYLSTMRGRFLIYKENALVLKWSLSYALISCAMYQIYNYIQPLWIEIDSVSKAENGLIEFINTALGAVISFGVQFVKLDGSSRLGDFFLFSSASILGVVTIVLSLTSSLWIAYGMYVMAVFIYHALSPISSTIIASQLEKSAYGFVFGANSLFALIIQTVITFTVVDKNYFELKMQQQFLIYASIFFLTSLIPMICSILKPVQLIHECPTESAILEDL